MEIDSINEMPDGRWAAIEIRLGAKINDGASSLLDFKYRMEKHKVKSVPCALCVVCGMSDHAYMRDDGVYVVPITMLGP